MAILITLTTLSFLSVLIVYAFTQEINSPSSSVPFSRYFISQECSIAFFQMNDWLNMTCWKKVIVKFLGYLAIIGSTVVKVPQIIKIIKNKTTFGVSYASILLESMRQLSAAAHNITMGNPFSVFGETLIMSVQSFIILVLFILYKDQKGLPLKFIGGIALFLVVFLAATNPTYFPSYILEHAMIVEMVLFASARLFQIVKIHTLKSTGSLSAITCTMNLLGNITRLGTALVEVAHDMLYRFSVLNAITLNSYVLLCFFIFRKPKKAE